MPSDVLPDDLETMKAMLLAERTQNERQCQIMKEMQRHRLGRRAETLPEDQMLSFRRRLKAAPKGLSRRMPSTYL
jgi:transposase